MSRENERSKTWTRGMHKEKIKKGFSRRCSTHTHAEQKKALGVLMMHSGADLHLSFKCCRLGARLSSKQYCNAFSHQDAGPFVR